MSNVMMLCANRAPSAVTVTKICQYIVNSVLVERATSISHPAVAARLHQPHLFTEHCTSSPALRLTRARPSVPQGRCTSTLSSISSYLNYHLCHHPSTRTMMSNLWIPRTASAVRALTALRRPTTLHLRYYRGQAGEAPPVLSEKEESLIKVAKPKSEEILAKHHRLPNVAEIPPASLDPTQNNLDIRRKRLIYRSKQRGWLEVDLLLGTWAHENVHLLTEDELDEYEAFVNFETIEYVQRACAGDHFPRFFFWKSSLLTPFCF